VVPGSTLFDSELSDLPQYKTMSCAAMNKRAATDPDLTSQWYLAEKPAIITVSKASMFPTNAHLYSAA
jgi:hypothetical protein